MAGALQAENGHGAAVGAQGKTSGVFQDIGHGLPFFQLINHGALDGSVHLDDPGIGRDQDYVSLFQADIGLLGALGQVFINIHDSHGLVSAHHFDVAQRTGIHHATGAVKRMERSRKTGKSISTGVSHVAHHIDLDGADLAQTQPHVRSRTAQTTIDGRQAFLEIGIGLFHGFTVQVEGAQDIYVDTSFRRNDFPDGGLILAEDVDDNLIVGTQAIVPRGCHGLAGRESHAARAEKVAAINFQTRIGNLLGGLLHDFLPILVRDLVPDIRLLPILKSLILSLCLIILFGIDTVPTALLRGQVLRFLPVLTLKVSLVHPLGLLPGHAPEAQFGHQFLLAPALGDSLTHMIQHLCIGHATLRPSQSCSQEKAGKQCRPSSFQYSHIRLIKSTFTQRYYFFLKVI